MRPDRLREWMELKGLSQAELARRAAVSPAAIQQLLNGSSKTTRSLRKIAEALEVSPDWLEGVSDATTVEGVKLAQFPGDGEVVKVAYIGVFKGPPFDRKKAGLRFLSVSKYWLEHITDGLDALDVSFHQVATDEMSPTISRGDDVCYRHEHAHDGMPDGIWFLSYNGVGLLRRVRPAKGAGFYLSADNPIIAPFEARADEIEFGGKVLWQGRSLTP